MNIRTAIGVVLVALATAPPSFAASSCAALTPVSTLAMRKADAAMIRRDDKGQVVMAAQIGRIMVEGPWRLVWATPINAERGVYFYRRNAKGTYRLVDTWGGILPAEERADGIAWTRRLKGGGPSERLAGCFADAVISGA